MSQTQLQSGYRRDIDGLRAVAVLAVVGYHAAPGRFPGGFIGVDIFFVISGFLISSIILKGLESGEFSFQDFYTRRVKRIFPALSIVLLACLAMGWFTLLPDEYKQLGKHIAGGAGFASNLLLWGESGYFDNTADKKPLLHLWSLGVEEQFYILWPPMLWLAWRRRTYFVALIIAILSISLGLNVQAVGVDKAEAFYSPYTRFWELAAGALLAYASLFDKRVVQMGASANNALTIAGAAFIASGLYFIDRESLFPGWWAILPVAGTAAIITAGSKAWINRALLSNRILVWIGLISFPLYLWHWVLLSFLRVMQSGEVPQRQRLFAVLFSFFLAWLTYKLVETPIRHGSRGEGIPKILAALMLVLGCAGYAVNARDGLRSRAALPHVVNEGAIGPYAYFEQLSRTYGSCTPENIRAEIGSWNGFPTCYQSLQNRPVDIAIIGDSHAEHLFPGLAEALSDKNVAIYGMDGLPLLNNPRFDKVFKFLLEDQAAKTVIIAARWSSKLDGDSVAAFESDLLKTVGALAAAKKKVYILDDVPNFEFEPNTCKFAGRLWREHKCTQDADLLPRQLRLFWPVQRSAASSHKNVKGINLGEYFCDNESCGMAQDGVLFYRDSNHLNVSGSAHLWRRILQNYPEFGHSAQL